MYMENITLLSQNELAKITNHRSGEIKFGEKIITIPTFFSRFQFPRLLFSVSENDILSIPKKYFFGQEDV